MPDQDCPASSTPPPRRMSDDEALLEFVRERDAPCPRCGYNLRALSRPVCPECSQNLVLKVGATNFSVFWLIAAVAPGIFSGITAIVFLVVAMLMGPPPTDVVVIGCLLAASGAVALAVILRARRFLRLGDDVQRTVAIITWLIHLLGFYLFLMWVGAI